ncbi:MAG: NADH-quinone oxidoreductase subunit NuoK [Thermomicrobia bacterium]|nr:NADH-quinone oxidoreductase subunit NuoK [Thermomicrobia bacterium]MCA1723705.1 NADH-quinone oxidoreductase subunit NuoK [Thermomicrobia bacterium]
MHPGLEWYLSLSAVLFVIGLIGVLTRRNVLVIFMCVEMMLNAVNISLIAFGRAISSATGQVFALFVITVAAAEAAVGLAIVIAIARRQDTTDVGRLDTLRD